MRRIKLKLVKKNPTIYYNVDNQRCVGCSKSNKDCAQTSHKLCSLEHVEWVHLLVVAHNTSQEPTNGGAQSVVDKKF